MRSRSEERRIERRVQPYSVSLTNKTEIKTQNHAEREEKEKYRKMVYAIHNSLRPT